MKYQNLRNPGEHKKKHTKKLQACAILVALAFTFSVFSFGVRAAGVRREVLRLHVVAHSDCEVDQQAKYAVRDAILAQGASLFDGSVCATEAEAIITPRIAELEAVALQALQQLELDHSVYISVDTAFFNTRSYAEAGLTFPAGRYQSVQVLIGDNDGENWWCVMFPPLCLPAATQRSSTTLDAVLTNGQLRVVEANPRFEVRFRIVELWESMLEHFRR